MAHDRTPAESSVTATPAQVPGAQALGLEPHLFDRLAVLYKYRWASIGIFLLRIAVDRTHRIILWTALIAIQLYSVYFFFIFTFQCWPVSFFWEQFRGGKGHCIPSELVVNSFYGYSALSCATDWTLSIVPIFIVQKLQMNTKKKITVGIVLAFCAM